MSETINDGGPAFPMCVPTARGTGVIYGMTLREYAAIKLRVPESGTDWLDEMIRESVRDEFAAKAMAQYLNAQQRDLLEIENGTSPYKSAHDASDIAELSYAMADAMLRARESK